MRQAEDQSKDQEFPFRQLFDAFPVLVLSGLPDGSVDFLNRRWFEFTGRSSDALKGEGWQKVLHGEDLEDFIQQCRSCAASGGPAERTVRIRSAGGEYRRFQVYWIPARAELGASGRWYGIAKEITGLGEIGEQVGQSEADLRQILDMIPAYVFVRTPDGRTLYANRQVVEFTGLPWEDISTEHRDAQLYHADDVERVRELTERMFAQGTAFEYEARVRTSRGEYRWCLIQINPLHDAQGRVARWFGAGRDIENLKRDEARLHGENIALREEIDKAFMFEEIVGSSEPLRAVSSLVAKVAPTDSTVLITGETGTGKELAARAIHKRSPRAGRPFLAVNCASIPATLIAAELFGHEKGAFTGATQRRIGRFELANGGTIFLDEVAEIPLEIQVTLLRVLQERSLERVGGSQPIAVDIRVIAATNRDLQRAVEAGTFRRDLLYRLNVFPIHMPPLRDRRGDIPLLVEYLTNRFARRMGKKIRRVEKSALELLEKYDWPGNIRELQNVLERGVILCEGETLVIDKSWLAGDGPRVASGRGRLGRLAATEEREMIERALMECRGHVAGPDGAAAKLGIPRSTLESRIRSLRIDKHRFFSS